MFAHNNRVRHLLSGGRHIFRDNDQSQKYLEGLKPFIDHDVQSLFDHDDHHTFSIHAGPAGVWRQVSTGAILLVDKDSPIAGYIGLADKKGAGKSESVHLRKSAN
jgi:hypothetical protein